MDIYELAFLDLNFQFLIHLSSLDGLHDLENESNYFILVIFNSENMVETWRQYYTWHFI